MKYDIEEMAIDAEELDRAIAGNATCLLLAFRWRKSPQGFVFWNAQYWGKTPLDIDALKDIKRQYMHHTGTAGKLKDMHVKAGDVVLSAASDFEYTVTERRPGVMALWCDRDGGRWSVYVDKSVQDYTLISLADDAHPAAPKKCRDMTAKIGDVGTLRGLDVKPGDVVQYCDSAHYAVAANRHLVNVSSGRDTGQYGCWDTCSKFRLISRATAQPTIWRDMTDAEKGALLLAAHEGKSIGIWFYDHWRWIDGPHKHVVCFDNVAYCVKPEPVRETVTLNGRGKKWRHTIVADATHRITFDTIDGQPDCSTIKMEPITKEESK